MLGALAAAVLLLGVWPEAADRPDGGLPIAALVQQLLPGQGLRNQPAHVLRHRPCCRCCPRPSARRDLRPAADRPASSTQSRRGLTHFLAIADPGLRGDPDPAHARRRGRRGRAVRAFGGMFVRDGVGDVLKLVRSTPSPSACFVYAKPYLRKSHSLFQGEFYVLALFARARHDAADFGRQPDHWSTSASSCWRCRSYALVALDRDSRAGFRGGDEVLRAGRAGLGPAAVRHVDDLRRDRHARPRADPRHRSRCPTTARCWPSAWCSSWSAWPSSSARRRSTCGCPTSTRARRPR